GQRSFLLTGDVEKRVEGEMVQRHASLDSDVLKVAHHGSRSSSLPEFLDRVSAVVAVISVAENSPFGHPHSEVLDELKKRHIAVFRTDQNGAVSIGTDGK